MFHLSKLKNESNMTFFFSSYDIFKWMPLILTKNISNLLLSLGWIIVYGVLSIIDFDIFCDEWFLFLSLRYDQRLKFFNKCNFFCFVKNFDLRLWWKTFPLMGIFERGNSSYINFKLKFFFKIMKCFSWLSWNLKQL